MNTSNIQKLIKLTTVALLLTVSVSAASVVSDNLQTLPQNAVSNFAFLESPALKIISDDDLATMKLIRHHIEADYTEFKTIDEVHAFLDKIAQLVHKHPKNVAFAQGELRELLKFLSQESVIRLIRVDTTPFTLPLNDDRVAIAQRAIEEDELTRKLFGAPVRRLVEARKQQLSRAEDGNHKDGNFFSNFWCKLSGNCNQ